MRDYREAQGRVGQVESMEKKIGRSGIYAIYAFPGSTSGQGPKSSPLELATDAVRGGMSIQQVKDQLRALIGYRRGNGL